MINKKRFWYGLFFIILALLLASSALLAACGGGGGEEETPLPTQTPVVTATPVPTTPAPTGTPPPTATGTPGGGVVIPEKPAGWQELASALTPEQNDTFKVNYYFPGEWITMTSQPLPTIILALDPTFFPNSELRTYDVPAGTTNAQFREIIKNMYPSEKGGEYDGFSVLEEGDVTLDNGLQTVYMIHKGTRMGYGAQAYDVFMVRGTQGFILQCGDYPVTFSDYKPLAMQIAKTLYSTIAMPGVGSVATPTPTPTPKPTTPAPTATPTPKPTTPAPTATAGPTTPAPTGTGAAIHTGLDINSTIGLLWDNPDTHALVAKWIPGFFDNPQASMARGFTFGALVPLSSGKITQAMVDGLAADLLKIK